MGFYVFFFSYKKRRGKKLCSVTKRQQETDSPSTVSHASQLLNPKQVKPQTSFCYSDGLRGVHETWEASGVA